MKLITMNELRKLKENEGSRCVSIVLPTGGRGADYDENRIRFKTLLNRAEKELETLGMAQRRRKELLEEARALERNRPYWKDCDEGLAAYASPHGFRTYRLPFPPEEDVLVSDRFNLRPLEHLLARQRRYFLLALGLGDNRLFEATPYTIREIPSDSLPEGIAETLRFDVFERHLQAHPTSRYTGRDSRMTFHGHDSEKEERGSNIRRYVKQVASEMTRILADETAPLVVATLPYLLPDLFEACRYPFLSRESVRVDPGHMTVKELHDRSGEIAGRIFDRELNEALERYGSAAAAGSATADQEEVVRSAAEGRVETLLLDPEHSIYGDYDPEDRTVTISGERRPGDSDLVSFAVEETLLKGGRVFTVESDRMPGGKGMTAILRY